MKLSDILYPPGTTRLDPTVAAGLFLILFSTQVTLTAPFSYLPAMVESFGYSNTERGFYAGFIASSLFIGRFFGGYFWGWLTDKIGRRPVLLISSTLVLVSTVAFGFSTSFSLAVITRFLQGLFNGVIVCGRAAFAEICDDTNQAIGVSLVFAAWNSAIVFGPAVGGFLAEPVSKYPNVFKNSTFLEKFPFVLPSFLVAVILMLAIGMIFFTFKETKPIRKNNKMSESEKDTKINRLDEERMPLLPNGSGEKKNVIFYGEQPVHISYLIPQQIPWYKRIWRRVQKWSLYELMTDKTVMLVIISFGISGFCIIGFSELSSLWMATKSIYGGLNFTTDKIGIALLVPAIFAVIIQPIIFARFERKFGGIKTLQVSLIILCIFTLLYPFVFYVLERKELLWTFLIIAGMFRMVADISSRSALALFINNSVYPEQAGRVNGLAFSIQEIMRVASPTLFGAMFSWAINENKHKVVFPLDYRLPFIVIGITIFGILLLSICLPKNINRAKQLDEMLDTIHLVEHNNTTIQPAGVAIRTSQVAEDTSTTNNN